MISTPFAKSSSRIASAVAKSFAFLASARRAIASLIYASSSASTDEPASARAFACPIKSSDSTLSKLSTKASFVASFVSALRASYKTVIAIDVFKSFETASKNLPSYSAFTVSSTAPSALSSDTLLTSLLYAVTVLSRFSQENTSGLR